MPFAQGVALLYLLVAGLWIYFSDELAEWMTETANQLRILSTYKGWFFVVVTAGLLFLVLKRFVSKIRLAQQKLRESEERFKIATEAGGIGVWDRDIVNDRLIWDDRMVELYGIHKRDFSGAYDAWAKCVHPDDLQRASVEVAAAERGGKPFDTEFRIIRPDGEVRHIRAFSKVVHAEDGTPLRMIGTNQDITERVEDEERFRMLFETMSSCVAIYKPLADNSDFELVNMNPIGLRYSKISREDLIGRKVTEVFPDVKASGVFGALQRVARTGTPEYLPLRHYKDERIELWVENHIFKLPSGLVVAVFEDISARKKMETALETRMNELERFNKAAVGRELRMIELKKEVNELCRELGKPVPYPVQNSARRPEESA
jgi:PAS domain S-box-containing protein